MFVIIDKSYFRVYYLARFKKLVPESFNRGAGCSDRFTPAPSPLYPPHGVGQGEGGVVSIWAASFDAVSGQRLRLSENATAFSGFMLIRITEKPIKSIEKMKCL